MNDFFHTNNGKNNCANPKKIKNPNTSVAVVTKIDEATAGSAPNLFKATGTKNPKTPATTRFPIIAIKIINPK